jgi:SPP1 gp7 family putative phage head morphogenesis protein
MFEFSDKEIEALLEGVFEGTITEYDLPEDLYFAIADYLKKGLYKGFGSSLTELAPDSKDFELLAELRENIYMFSAAKTYQEVKEISDWLVDEEGERRSKSEFQELGRQTFSTWNDAYGDAEYDTAIGMAENAVKWQQIEEQKDVLPILRYSAVGDENTCEICQPLDGLTAPVDDPVWDTIMPENHFRCRCLVEQLEEGETSENKDEVVAQVHEEMDDIFKMNPGKDKVVFTDDHPYFQVETKDKGFAEENFGLPIPKDDE